MDSAYIYVRVSTDEQKRNGFSLIEQEDRLVKYCEQNHIKIKGIFKEDYSAKDFDRPEWKKLIKAIKNNKRRPPGCILFIRWDRFSRNIANAYRWCLAIFKKQFWFRHQRQENNRKINQSLQRNTGFNTQKGAA